MQITAAEAAALLAIGTLRKDGWTDNAIDLYFSQQCGENSMTYRLISCVLHKTEELETENELK